jgi:hypothetical protein
MRRVCPLYAAIRMVTQCERNLRRRAITAVVARTSNHARECRYFGGGPSAHCAVGFFCCFILSSSNAPVQLATFAPQLPESSLERITAGMPLFASSRQVFAAACVAAWHCCAVTEKHCRKYQSSRQMNPGRVASNRSAHCDWVSSVAPLAPPDSARKTRQGPTTRATANRIQSSLAIRNLI